MIWIPFEPKSLANPQARRIVRDCARALDVVLGTPTASQVADIRKDLVRRCGDLPATVADLTILCCSILCDLRGQGWRTRVEGRRIMMAIPTSDTASPDERKAQVRAAHLLERDVQLLQGPARKFIREMERRRLHGARWCSIFSLMRDGQELASALREIAALPPGAGRAMALRRCVDPYVQPIRADDTCEFTGLRLMDVWRYFRHTWTTSYLSTPGRKLWFLVRDRAAPNHPIVGIGALGSAIVQLSPRDRWIGWTRPNLLRD